jgi:ABC-type nitrate/sulfonate/bicarbonate transport system permease component
VARIEAVRAPAAAPLIGATLAWRLARWSSIVVLVVAWEAFARSGAVTTFMLPPLSMVFERIWDDAMSGDLGVALFETLYRALAGFAIAAVPGVVLGILIARLAPVRWFFDPVISVGFPMPKIAFIPIIVLWFGFYDVSKISIVVFDAIFPIITATIAGTRGVDRNLLWSARSLGASERELLREIVLPAALPQILTGLQVALPIALIVTIIAEMTTASSGLGGEMLHASRFVDSLGVFAALVEIAIVGLLLIKIMAVARTRLLHWHQEARQPRTV